jgi:hypothetical protein
MTHWGMKEPEMEEIARLFKECLIDRKDVRPEVHRLRARFLDVHYSFDARSAASEASAAAGTVDVDLAGY